MIPYSKKETFGMNLSKCILIINNLFRRYSVWIPQEQVAVVRGRNVRNRGEFVGRFRRTNRRTHFDE